jgi:hypothetical protein
MSTLTAGFRYPFHPTARLIRPLLLLFLALATYFVYLQFTTDRLPFNLPGRPSFTFVPNRGQSDPAVRFQTHSLGANIYFTEDSVRLGGAAQLHFLGTAAHSTIEGQEIQPGVVNYLAGQNPDQWHSNLPTYGSLAYPGFYSGVDLHWQGRDGRLVGTFTADPGANIQQIRWRYEGITPQLDETTGELWLVNEAGETAVVQAAPAAWQIINGEQMIVPVSYAFAEGGAIGLHIGSYQATYPLMIVLDLDSLISYPPNDAAFDIAVDNEGYVYITGTTYSGDFPVTTDAFQPSIGASQTADAFVTKLSPDGQTLVYGTFLGGSGDDEARGIEIDAAGNLFIGGQTNSFDFPVQNALQPQIGGSWDAFVVKLSADGTTLIYSTYFGGSSTDVSRAIAIDGAANAYFTGDTWSTDFPVMNPIQAAKAGHKDAFVVKLTADGNTIAYSTYLGGSELEQGWAIAVNEMGEAYIAGETASTDFPVVNAFQPTSQDPWDAFVARLSTTGNTLIYSTYLGGERSEGGYGIAVNDSDHAFVVGHTGSPDFPVVNAFQPVMSSLDGEGFVTEFVPAGNNLVYSSYFGGSGSETIQSIALDSNENMYITGRTTSLDFPTFNPIQPALSSGSSVDAFVTRFAVGGSTLAYSTYLGGYPADSGAAITVDGDNYALVTGATHSTDFPLANALQAYNAGGSDAFISKLSINGNIFEFSTYLGGSSAYPGPTHVTVTDINQPVLWDQGLLYLFVGLVITIGGIWLYFAYQRVIKFKVN